ncbi:MAG: hypothetical protein ACXU8S_05305 [Phenylobacterium sp.]
MEPADQIEVIHRELRIAADAILDATTAAMALTTTARAGDRQALDALDGLLLAILEATAFEDLAGQRLARLSASLSGQTRIEDPLLNGPTDTSEGLDQDMADALFGSEPDGP